MEHVKEWIITEVAGKYMMFMGVVQVFLCVVGIVFNLGYDTLVGRLTLEFGWAQIAGFVMLGAILVGSIVQIIIGYIIDDFTDGLWEPEP